MANDHRWRRLITVASALVVFAAVPAVASAQTDEVRAESDRVPSDRALTDRVTDRPAHDRDFDAVKERLLAEINKRLEALDRMSAKVDENEHVSSNHAAALQKDYKDAGKILEDAAEDIEDAETFEELREIVPEVFLETLVFALLAPKTGLVLGSHTLVAAADRMEDFAEKLQEIIGFLAARGYDMTAAQAALDDMGDSLASAAALAAPVAGNVIDLDQDDWEEPAKTTLEQGKDDLQGSREALREAHRHAQATVQAIREALSS